ncbi:MAG: hypothetical protein KU37_10560 [Sulfuricurvum sp. PC08-66]|nr:MAG: hypothetical protein KU37_10560 [Sulfuricurvum sp. PC08-66]
MRGKYLGSIVLLLSCLAGEEVEMLDAIEVKESGYIEQGDYMNLAPMQKRLSVDDALEIPGTNGDPLKAIKTFAGVTSTDNDNGEMIIHGSKPRETRFELNHLPLGYVFHLGGLHSVISPEATQQIDAFLGAFDVSYYGMGAVVDITPRYPTGDNAVKIHIGLYDADMSGDIRITDTISLFIGARRSYFDLFAPSIMTYLDDEETLTFTLFPQFWDLNTILSADFGAHQLSFELISSQDDLKLHDNNASLTDPLAKGKIEQSMGFTTAGIRWKYEGQNYTANTLLYQLREQSQTQLFDNGYYVTSSTTESALQHDSIVDWSGHTSTLGFHLMLNQSAVDANITRPPASDGVGGFIVSGAEIITIDDTYLAQAHVLYLQDIWSLTDTLRVRYGVRAWNTLFQSFGVVANPRGAVVWDITPDVSLSLAVGQYSQLPSITTVIDQFGNPDIGTYENSNHYAMNLRTVFADNSDLSIEPYYKTFDTLVIEDGNGSYCNVGRGEAYGVDVTYTKEIGDWQLVGAYTFVQAKRQIYGNDSTWYRFYGEIPHTLQLSSIYRWGDSGWSVGGLFKYSDGKPYTPVTGYTSTTYNGTTYNAATYGTPWSMSLPRTFDLDMKVSFKRNHSDTLREEWSLELMNLTTLVRKNVSAIKYSDTYEEEGYYYQMGFLPAFHYTVWF